MEMHEFDIGDVFGHPSGASIRVSGIGETKVLVVVEAKAQNADHPFNSILTPLGGEVAIRPSQVDGTKWVRGVVAPGWIRLAEDSYRSAYHPGFRVSVSPEGDLRFANSDGVLISPLHLRELLRVVAPMMIQPVEGPGDPLPVPPS